MTDTADAAPNWRASTRLIARSAGGRGAARALVEAVIAKARELGLSELITHASRTARPTFERLYFEVERANDQTWIRGENLPNFDTRLKLA